MQGKVFDDVQKHPGGRPAKVIDDEKQEILQAFEKYVEDEDYPTITGFCRRNRIARKYKVTRDNINDWEEFTTLRKRAIQFQELYIEEGTLHGKLNAPFAMFKLKQPAMGWTDKQQIEHANNPDNPLTNPAEQSSIDTFIDYLKNDTNHQAKSG